MLKTYYYTTQDYNGMIITDGTEAIEIKDFPQDGTLDMANGWDLSAIAGCENLADVEESIGVELERIAFIEDEFETLVEIGMPDFEVSRDEMWNFVNAGIITENGILEEIEGIEAIRNKEAWAKAMAELIKEDDLDGNGTTYYAGATYALIQQAHYNAGTGEYEALCIKIDPEYEDGLYKAYWSIKEGCENELEEDMCDWDYADTVEREYI